MEILDDVLSTLVAERLPEDSLVVTLFPDSGERYLSKLNRDWLAAHGLEGVDA